MVEIVYKILLEGELLKSKGIRFMDIGVWGQMMQEMVHV
jgi:hypothetical protein